MSVKRRRDRELVRANLTGEASVSCALCRNSVFSPLKSSRLAHLHRCEICGLVSSRTMPSDDTILELYSEDYFRGSTSETVGYEDYARDKDHVQATARRRLRLIESTGVRPGKMVDVGSALGFFAAAARERGWDPYCVDVSAHAIEYAQGELGLAGGVGTLSSLSLESDAYSLVTMWDVVEHMPEFLDELREVWRILEPGGVLALTTPDLGSMVARMTRDRWMGFKLADEHLHYFDRKTMTAALRAAGFTPLKTTGVGKDISFGFFLRRLNLYLPGVGSVLGRVADVTRVGSRSLYVNPRDIMLIVCRKT
jgi:2-polyprenyl-3-methyl-5-hydroxy-6-metoxy-1,4-benzoquinol methylase